ncbi:MAG: hypothetical protein J0H73_11865 [Salana multivorans]|mgnify:CR=1 FL=1|uniref:beta barrel domain-containing protein n=1 Tax=Salana multivorans TaxID=120377 RepID=UPI00095FF72C|nr:hypothetical protein [Salana multivorans]MBN8882996.1 hypothetical protein [Salana multivorans]OJX94052.1 MAG: hypothetical protein BGO96_09605 [Micrococcales bacterium 73-15]
MTSPCQYVTARDIGARCGADSIHGTDLCRDHADPDLLALIDGEDDMTTPQSITTTAPTWAVGQRVLRIRNYRPGFVDEMVVSRVGRKYVYVTWPGGRAEEKYDIATGRQASVVSQSRILTHAQHEQEKVDQAIRDDVLAAGWEPRHHRTRPMSEWRAIAAALGILLPDSTPRPGDEQDAASMDGGQDR